MAEFLQKAEENDAKWWQMEAEIEQKRREEERKHEERMMMMMIGVMQQIAGVTDPHSAHISTRLPPYSVPFPNNIPQTSQPPSQVFPPPGPSNAFSTPSYPFPQPNFNSGVYDNEDEN